MCTQYIKRVSSCAEVFESDPPALQDLTGESFTCPICDQPLSIALADNIQDGLKGPGSLLDALMKQGKYLDHVIGEVFVFSSLESDSVQLRLATLTIAETIDDVVESARALAASRWVNFNYDMPHPHTLLQVDADRLGTALHYLLHNAVVYTQSGGNVLFSIQQSEV